MPANNLKTKVFLSSGHLRHECRQYHPSSSDMMLKSSGSSDGRRAYKLVRFINGVLMFRPE